MRNISPKVNASGGRPQVRMRHTFRVLSFPCKSVLYSPHHKGGGLKPRATFFQPVHSSPIPPSLPRTPIPTSAGQLGSASKRSNSKRVWRNE